MNRAALAAGLAGLVAAVALAGCGADARDQVLGGRRISGERLARGERLYERYCATCHGERGDGLGPASTFQSPPPRDLRTAAFKFAPAAEGDLPADADIARVIRAGLEGTAMRPWPIPEGELGAIVDYIKTFSPPRRGFRDRGRRQRRPGTPPDPYAAPGRMAEARAEGARLYHAVFECQQCHPAYASPAELAAWRARPRLVAPEAPVPRWSATHRSVLLPPDFRRHPMRFARTPADLFAVIAHGMQGPMPAYGHLGADRIWAVAHYVAGLAAERAGR